MRHDLNLLIEKSPESISPWIPPRELARLLGVSSQTITASEFVGNFQDWFSFLVKQANFLLLFYRERSLFAHQLASASLAMAALRSVAVIHRW